MKKLVQKHFFYADDVTAFVNKYKIDKEDIASIVTGDRFSSGYYLFYWTIVTEK